MNYFRQQITHFFNTFSIYNFIMLVFGLPFLSEGLFLFFRQSFLNNLYHPLYLLLFAALIFLYGNFFSQVQSNEKGFQNFSLKAAFVSFAYWLLLSPIFFIISSSCFREFVISIFCITIFSFSLVLSLFPPYKR